MNKEELIEFEEHIKQCYLNKEILAPIHLRGGCEDQIIKVFEHVKENDYVLCSWASHLQALLKGIPKDKIKQRILDGLSISLCFPEHRFFSSGIVGNLVGAAVGLGMAIKKQGGSENVWIWIGDMTAETGIVHEAMKYTKNFDLPVWWVIEDNGVSVLTDTKKSWNSNKPQFDWDHPRGFYYYYKNSYNHSGVGAKVAF
jgi:TPP-dependent pyruvate/acetoin dehydrogenase alpha subunit